jgi:Ni/Co efflux regulator RcnB
MKTTVAAASALTLAMSHTAHADQWFDRWSDQMQRQLDRQNEQYERQNEQQNEQYRRQREEWNRGYRTDDGD